jgi:hypothetical protein
MRTRPHLRAFVLAGSISLTLMFSSRAIAQDFTGRAILSYQLFSDDAIDSNAFLQTYDADFHRDLSDNMRLRLSFRAQGNNRRTEFPLFEQKTNYWRLQPSGEFDYLLPRLQVIGRYDLYETTSKIAELDWRQRNQRITESLFWFPDSLPSFSLQGLQLTNEQPSANVDEVENLAYETINYTWRGLTVGQAANYDKFEMRQSGFSRTAKNIQGLLKFSGALPDGRLVADVNAVAGRTRLEESAGGQDVSAPTRVAIASAQYSHDETPLDSRDVHPAAAPALIDGDFKQSAQISVGPDGESFQNIAVNPGRFIGLDTFRVYVRDAAGNPVQFGGLVRWDVFVSGEGLDWMPVSGETTTTFLTGTSAYEVTFPRASSRYFKLVSFGTNSITTLVTEVEAAFHVAFTPRVTRETDIKFISAAASLSSRLTNWLMLSYYGNFNDYKVNPGGTQEYATTDNDQLVSALFTPLDRLQLTLRYQRRRVGNADFDQSQDGAWAILQYDLNPNLSTSVEASRTKDTGSLDVTTDTLRIHEYARFLPSLDLSVDMGVSKFDFARENAQSKQLFLNAVSYAQLTSGIRLALSGNFTKLTNPENVFGLREGVNQNYYAEIYYRPGPQLYLSARYGFARTENESAKTRRFRVEWYPFAGGTVGIGTIFDQDVDTNGGFRKFRRLQILPTWIVNPNVALNLNYNVLRFESGGFAGAPPPATAKQFFMTLTVTR